MKDKNGYVKWTVFMASMALLLGLAGIIFGFTQANASDIREVELKQADYDSNIGWIKEALTEIKEQLK